MNPSPEVKAAARRANPRSNSTWFEAAERGEGTRMCQLLDSADAAVDDVDAQSGWPALYYAAWKNYVWMAEWLLERGASAEVASAEGDTPVHVAALYGHHEVLGLLLAQKAVHTRNSFGKTPLDLARQKRQWDCVGALEKALGLPLSPEVTALPPPLPKDWQEGDYGDGKKFYFNPFSGDTSETRPPPEGFSA